MILEVAKILKNVLQEKIIVINATQKEIYAQNVKIVFFQMKMVVAHIQQIVKYLKKGNVLNSLKTLF